VTALRSKRKVSQVLLSESLGYSSYYLGRIERGTANASCDVMAAVSEYFGMTIGQFWIYAERLAKTPPSSK
jgi:transcriptional regulator with XRE-family HTH domain